MNKKYWFFIIFFLILIISASLSLLYFNNSNDQDPDNPEIPTETEEPETLTEPEEPETPTEPEEPEIPTEPDSPEEPEIPIEIPNVFWQINLENFISDIAYDDKRIFVVDGVNVICLNITSGEQLWISEEIGHTTSHSKLVLYKNSVYAGSYGGKVTSFNKITGQKLLEFQAPVSSTWGGKETPQHFFIEDGRLFVYQNGYAVFNSTTGELFYENKDGWTIELGNASATDFDGIFISRYGNGRINPNNGETIWSVSGQFSEPAVVSEDKVILWNYNPDEQYGYLDLGEFIISVDANSGVILWSYNVSSLTYQPIIHDGLVLFATCDGYFNALNFTNGNFVWRVQIVSSNITNLLENEGSNYRSFASPILIDSEKKEAIWSYVIQNSSIEKKYEGILCKIDLDDALLIWKTQIENNSSLTTNTFLIAGRGPVFLGLALKNDIVYLTVGPDFYIFSSQNGDVIQEKNFDHHLLRPISSEDIVFVAEELHLIANK